MNRLFLTALLTMLIYPDTELPAAAVPPPNYDESKVPDYVLPDPLLTKDGRKVNSVRLWKEVRRPELLELFTEEMFGRSPFPLDDPKAVGISIQIDKLANADPAVVNGKGTRHQIRLRLFKGEQPKDDDPKIDVLIYTPNNARGRTPVFLGLNFRGNHTVSADPGIVLGTVWARPEGSKDFAPLPAKEEDRGSMAGRWPIEMILDRGFAAATAYYGDIEPDFNGGINHGVRRLGGWKDKELLPNEAGAIATWAWGLGMIRDALETNAESLKIDVEKIALVGHSRLGKTALWAGATNLKFALAVSNNSGGSGAKLSRRWFGETPLAVNTLFPYWFCGNYKKYNHDVNSLPFDQHELIALLAPRPVYIASADEDHWADPRGEFLSAFHADPVYHLLGKGGLYGVTMMPPPGPSVGGTIGYHLRPGKHDVTPFDWQRFLDFAAKHFRM